LEEERKVTNEDDLKVRGIDSPIGPLTLTACGERLCRIDFGVPEEVRDRVIRWAKHCGLPTTICIDRHACEPAAKQLCAYFTGVRKGFDLKLMLEGTAFQKRVWTALSRIPYGETRTYKQVAEAVGRWKAVRAVGSANHANPLPIVIPCHRVIGSDGSLVGYGGGLDRKEWMLQLEKAGSAD
jgi:O-6-methylguanine DNA methyltransferase